jgi:hypothetical protein
MAEFGFDSLHAERQLEILDVTYSVGQDWADKYLVTSRWLATGYGALTTLVFTYFEQLVASGVSKNELIFVVVFLILAFCLASYVHLSVLDFYRECGELRIAVKLNVAEQIKEFLARAKSS